ncbi:hypothetical protein [Alistipes putredinis]|uniref:hypothetical protein n=1 Tax=Alistipes putredinis TaxID=28117 RepID=UPI003AB83CDB
MSHFDRAAARGSFALISLYYIAFTGLLLSSALSHFVFTPIYSDKLLDVLDMKDASMDSWGGVSVNYTFRIVGGLGVGATFVYSGNNQRLAGKKISTDYYSIMPHLKMRWLNLRILSLYSRVGVGLTFTESSGEGQSESARQWAFQVSPIGVEIGGKVAAYAEAGIGTMGSLVAGLRFRF